MGCNGSDQLGVVREGALVKVRGREGDGVCRVCEARFRGAVGAMLGILRSVGLQQEGGLLVAV